MIIPIVASTTRDLFLQVPPLPKEGGEALGMTSWEVANRITLPWVRSGIIGASVLGLGRALGETIAVALVGGASLHVAPNIYQPFGTIAATILTQLEGALTDGTGFAVATLAELALVLAVISVAVNLAAALDRRPQLASGRPGGWSMSAEPAPTLAAGPSTRRRRLGSIGFRAFTYASLALIVLPAAWVLLGVLARAAAHWRWDVLWTPLTAEGGGLRDQILGTLVLMFGTLVIAGTVGVLAGIHLSEMAKVRADGRRRGGVPTHGVGRPLGLPLHRARLRRVLGAGDRAPLGLLAVGRPDHPLHHGHALHRQDDGELPAPGADRLPGGGGGARHDDGLLAAQGGAEERAAGHRHRPPAGHGHRLRRDGPADLHGGVLQHAAQQLDPRPVPLPDLRGVHVLRPAQRRRTTTWPTTLRSSWS